MNQLTTQELDLIGHSLGINVYHAQRSKKKKDKILPAEFYRNRFCTGPNSDNYTDILELVNKGLMAQGKTAVTPDHFFYVTDTGIEIFRNEFKEHVINQIN